MMNKIEGKRHISRYSIFCCHLFLSVGRHRGEPDCQLIEGGQLELKYHTVTFLDAFREGVGVKSIESDN